MQNKQIDIILKQNHKNFHNKDYLCMNILTTPNQNQTVSSMS